jgi:hypothetical protein
MELQYHGLHPWLLLDAPSVLWQNEFLSSFLLLCGLSLRQTGLWLKKRNLYSKPSNSVGFRLQINVGRKDLKG